MSLSQQDADAIIGLAHRMGVDPGSLAGLMHMESGINPNIWGGAGGNYRGLIQFGPGARQEVGLPSGPMTIAEQVPYVERYFNSRGFKPGMSAEQMYRTVLVGNPHQAGTDSWGTNSDSTGARMRPGGDLWQIGSKALSGATPGLMSQFSAPSSPQSSRKIPSPTGLNDDLVGLSPQNAAAVAGIRALMPEAEQPLREAQQQPMRQADEQPSAPKSGLERMAATSVASIFGPALEMSRQGNTRGGQPQPLAGERMGGFSPIEYLTGDPDHPGYRDDHAGSNYHEHIAFRTTAERDAAMAKLRAHGIEIGSVNDGQHSPNSYHYADLAFDVPAHQVPVGQEQALSRRVRAILGF